MQSNAKKHDKENYKKQTLGEEDMRRQSGELVAWVSKVGLRNRIMGPETKCRPSSTVRIISLGCGLSALNALGCI